MSVQQSAFNCQHSAVSRIVFVLLLLLTIHFSLFTFVAVAAEKWQGVDESVVKKIAKEHGREAKEPLINTDQGDLLLFVFLVAGTIGGFIAGYSWRKLTEGDARKKQRTKTDGTPV
jgi:ABC-type cobalt transport system substrate-binding protein